MWNQELIGMLSADLVTFALAVWPERRVHWSISFGVSKHICTTLMSTEHVSSIPRYLEISIDVP